MAAAALLDGHGDVDVTGTSQPISPELRRIEEFEQWKIDTVYFDRAGESVAYVTKDFHDAWHAELRARWQRDIDLLNSIYALLTDAKTRGTDE